MLISDYCIGAHLLLQGNFVFTVWSTNCIVTGCCHGVMFTRYFVRVQCSAIAMVDIFFLLLNCREPMLWCSENWAWVLG